MHYWTSPPGAVELHPSGSCRGPGPNTSPRGVGPEGWRVYPGIPVSHWLRAMSRAIQSQHFRWLLVWALGRLAGVVQATGFGWSASDGSCWWEMGGPLAISCYTGQFQHLFKGVDCFAS